MTANWADEPHARGHGSQDGTGSALEGVRVLDFSTLLPGPLATLLLAEAGADVVKVERPGAGDEMREYHPRLATTSANFAHLNRGKRSVSADLKQASDRQTVLDMARVADVLVEQFRPGVMERLGFGYDDLARANPGLVYCSITGYGRQGEHSHMAGHDLNYQASTGLLSLVTDSEGTPALPATLTADITAGAYPAVINILLALRAREHTGRGAYLDVSMTGNLATLGYAALAARAVGAPWPLPSAELLTGGSPRYRTYRTCDDRHLAVACLEDRFWFRFCELIDLPAPLRSPAADSRTVIQAVEARIAARSAAQWRAVFGSEDVCCTVVATFAEAVTAHPPPAQHRLKGPGYDVPALPVPIAASLRPAQSTRPYPELGQHNQVYGIGGSS